MTPDQGRGPHLPQARCRAHLPRGDRYRRCSLMRCRWRWY